MQRSTPHWQPTNEMSDVSMYSKVLPSRRRPPLQPERTHYTWDDLPTAKREAALQLVREARRRKRLARRWLIACVAVLLIMGVAFTALVLVPATGLAP